MRKTCVILLVRICFTYNETFLYLEALTSTTLFRSYNFSIFQVPVPPERLATIAVRSRSFTKVAAITVARE